MSISENKYHFVIATTKTKTEFRNTPICTYLEKSDNFKNCSVFYQNNKGLTKLYNRFISESFKHKKVIFVHDDVLIEDLFLEEKLNIAFQKYDIVGLAGSKKCDLKKTPAWHLMSDKEDFCGEVAHSHEGKVWTTVFGPTESRVLIMDGLFIAVNVERLLETKTTFDENFDFHHYDISFCLNANKNKLKMGVTPIKVVHFGLGDSMTTIEWRKSADKFIKLYRNDKQG